MVAETDGSKPAKGNLEFHTIFKTYSPPPQKKFHNTLENIVNSV
jgi:hypothetical protein